jgi:hypothetical protein
MLNQQSLLTVTASLTGAERARPEPRQTEIDKKTHASSPQIPINHGRDEALLLLAN